MTARYNKLGDPRYVPGVSQHDDDMTDAQWGEAMGNPEGPLMPLRSFEVVYLPDPPAVAYSETVTVDTQEVSEEAHGLLTEYLIERGMAHEWRYRAVQG